jgi:hypothetical protein
MSQSNLRIALVFNPEDQTWIRRTSLAVPDFWRGHGVAPMTGDVFRLGGRQFTVQGRLWEQDGEGTVLRVFVGSAHAESDSVFG